MIVPLRGSLGRLALLHLLLPSGPAAAASPSWRGEPRKRSSGRGTASVPLLPSLARIPRSDWCNVRDFGAVGDGVADDTEALQAGLDAISADNAHNRTLFFPEGTYRVTKSLFQNYTYGAQLLGTGRGSVLRWGGARDPSARIYWSSGNSRNIVEGLVFDGAGLAGVGYDHDTHGAYYETREVSQLRRNRV